MRLLRAIILSSFLLTLSNPAWGRVFLQWTEPAIPSAKAIGVNELVVQWNPRKIQLMNAAKEQGYRVFTEAPAQDATAAADAAAANGLAGIIVEDDSNEPGQGPTLELVQRLHRSHPGISVLGLDPGGKQPQIRGNLVVRREGVLEVSSPTEKPWIDSNVALVRFEKAFHPGKLPFFSFSWDLTDPLERQEGPRAADYSLAIAEAGAMHADLILPVHPNLQKALAGGDATAWHEWNQIKTYIRFYSKMRLGMAEPWANIAVVADNFQDAYEAMNLLARHNIPFLVLPSGEVTPHRLSRLQLVIMFSRPQGQSVRELRDFCSEGGTVVFVNQHVPFPKDVVPVAKMSYGSSYTMGRGRVIEFSGPVGDPEEFAEIVRGLLNHGSVLIHLWNALTTLGFAYIRPDDGNMVLELVNYAQEPLRVQVRVKASFSKIRYETPEHGFYPQIHSEHEDGFTEFVVPRLSIGGRVYLSPAEKHKKQKQTD